ncbi:MAG: glycosyltransferase family 4 protein [Sulfurovum sp.]|nr:glycosyltransferase family 4 protein [Sulfurovum sp.]
MKNNKIVQIIPYFNSRYGGPPYVAKSLNTFFNLNGYNSILLTVDNYESSTHTVFFKMSIRKFWYSYDFMMHSIKYIKNSDIVFVHGLYTFVSLWGTFIAYLYGKKIYLLPHGMLDNNSINSSGVIKNTLRKFFLYTIGYFQVKVSQKVIFNSKKEMENSLFSHNAVIIANGVDLHYIDTIQTHKNYFSKEKVSLFFLGRLHKIKGIELILDAIDKLDDNIKEKIELIIAGTGDTDYIKFLQDSSDINTTKFIGHIDSDTKYNYLKQCDIYLQPSFTEGLSISMLEAMACRVNMITTNRVGLFEELIDKEAAMIIEYNSTKLKLAILSLINTRNKYRDNGYEMIKEKYNWNVILNDYIDLIGAN